MDLKDENGTVKSMNISLHVVGTPFELDCFELVEEEGIPLKNARSSARPMRSGLDPFAGNIPCFLYGTVEA